MQVWPGGAGVGGKAGGDGNRAQVALWVMGRHPGRGGRGQRCGVCGGRGDAAPALVYCGLGGPGAPAQLPVLGGSGGCSGGCGSRAGPHRHPATMGHEAQRWLGLGGPQEVVWVGGAARGLPPHRLGRVGSPGPPSTPTPTTPTTTHASYCCLGVGGGRGWAGAVSAALHVRRLWVEVVAHPPNAGVA